MKFFKHDVFSFVTKIKRVIALTKKSKVEMFLRAGRLLYALKCIKRV